jgi:hypothetical protein
MPPTTRRLGSRGAYRALAALAREVSRARQQPRPGGAELLGDQR